MATVSRKGRATCLCLDREAAAMLREIAPGQKSLGQFVSGLIKAEVARREERLRLKAAVNRAFADGSGVTTID